MNRETIMEALFALLAGSATFATTGRRLKHWAKCPAQPAMFLRNEAEEYLPRASRMPARVVMECQVWVYSNAGGNPDVAPAISLNGLIDAIGAALNPFPLETQTLGGLVAHCWIEGKIDLHPGDLDGQAIAVIPVKILVPSFGG